MYLRLVPTKLELLFNERNLLFTSLGGLYRFTSYANDVWLEIYFFPTISWGTSHRRIELYFYRHSLFCILIQAERRRSQIFEQTAKASWSMKETFNIKGLRKIWDKLRDKWVRLPGLRYNAIACPLPSKVGCSTSCSGKGRFSSSASMALSFGVTISHPWWTHCIADTT